MLEKNFVLFRQALQALFSLVTEGRVTEIVT
jgi:hypothetical protein